MPFDRDSGLVFSEKIVKKLKERLHAENARSLGQLPERRSTGDGPDSLYLIALRKLFWNLKKLDTDSLSTVPEAILVKIWKAIKRS